MVEQQLENQNLEEIENVIFSYTAAQAVEDGVLAKLGKSNHLVTNNLLVAMQKKHSMELGECLNFILCELLPLVPYAFNEYNNRNGILKTNYKFKVGNFKHSEIIWMIPNELGGLTLMKPEDY